MNSRMIAPRNDIRKPALSLGPYQPAARPTQPPSSAPAMPSSIVTMIPPGSRPGITSLASAPTIRPKIIHPITPNIAVTSGTNRVANQGPGPADNGCVKNLRIFAPLTNGEQLEFSGAATGQELIRGLMGDEL